MLRVFLIFERITVHPVVYLSATSDPREVIWAYVQDREPEAEIKQDGSVRIRHGDREVVYSHLLAYIEAASKPFGE